MKTIQNNPTLQKRLLGYTAMAGLVAAAGVGAGAQQAAAQPTVVAEPNMTLVDGETFSFDFDGNITSEFTIRVGNSYIDLIGFSQSVSFLGDRTGPVSFGYPYALNQGDPISSAVANWFQPSTWATLTTGTGSDGYWVDLTGIRYVGVRYVSSVDSQVHYGWVELTVVDADPGPVQVTIHRYGHNTIAGAAIPAAVQLTDVQASSSPLRAAGAAVLTAVAGALTWLRLRVGRQEQAD